MTIIKQGRMTHLWETHTHVPGCILLSGYLSYLIYIRIYLLLTCLLKNLFYNVLNKPKLWFINYLILKFFSAWKRFLGLLELSSLQINGMIQATKSDALEMCCCPVTTNSLSVVYNRNKKVFFILEWINKETGKYTIFILRRIKCWISSGFSFNMSTAVASFFWLHIFNSDADFCWKSQFFIFLYLM